MKNIWLCPHCEQTSTRHWNLKTHIDRKHHGMGKPVSVNPSSTRNLSKNTGTIGRIDATASHDEHQQSMKPESERQPQAKHFLRDYLEWVGPIAEFDRIIKGLSAPSFQTSRASDNDPSFLGQGRPANQLSQTNLKPVLGYKFVLVPNKYFISCLLF